MATTLKEIEEYLRQEDLRFSVQDDFIRTSFATDSYTDAEGEHSIFVVIKPEEDGEYFKVIAPNVYSSSPGDGALFQALLMISWKTKLVQFEFDDRDGEVRAIVEFPVEDSRLSRRQLMRCVNGLVQIIDEYHPVVVRAMQTGVVDFGDKVSDPNHPAANPAATRTSQTADIMKLAEEYYAFMGKKGGHAAARIELEE